MCLDDDSGLGKANITDKVEADWGRLNVEERIDRTGSEDSHAYDCTLLLIIYLFVCFFYFSWVTVEWSPLHDFFQLFRQPPSPWTLLTVIELSGPIFASPLEKFRSSFKPYNTLWLGYDSPFRNPEGNSEIAKFTTVLFLHLEKVELLGNSNFRDDCILKNQVDTL